MEKFKNIEKRSLLFIYVIKIDENNVFFEILQTSSRNKNSFKIEI